MNRGYIYRIKNRINGKVYIGQTRQPYKRRWRSHVRELNNKKHTNSILQEEWDKYGEENFEFKIIDECETNKLDEKEIYWIDYYNSCFDRSKGYNLNSGGGVGSRSSEEIRKAKRGKNNPMYGVKKSKEEIEYIRRINRGRSDLLDSEKVTEIKIRLCKGEEQRILAKEFGVDHTTINKIKTCKNWDWVLPELNNKLANMDKILEKEVLEKHRKGLANYKIAKILNISEARVAKILKSNGLISNARNDTDLSDKEKEKIIIMLRNGYTVKEIALDLKRCRQLVARKIKDMGIEIKNRTSSKLTEANVREIKLMIQEGRTLREIGRKFGVARTTISDIKHERTWKDVVV